MTNLEMFPKREIISSLSHFVGALLSVAALVFLILAAVQNGSAREIVGFTIFGTSLILLYITSSWYHFLKSISWRKVFQRLDNSMIFILIAGTYTAVSLALPNHAWGWSLFGAEWGLAVLGLSLQFFEFKGRQYVVQALYVIMGWLALIAFPVFLGALSTTALFLLVGGGLLYTIGIAFFVLHKFFPERRLVNFHDVFHFFVMAGSASHFLLAYKYLL